MDGQEKPFPASDFDDWAASYDDSVVNDSFPFSGYQRVLERILTLASPKAGMRVLDLGTGTAELALPFARTGCELWCTDFSGAMLEKARKKLPGAQLCLHDLRTPLPAEITGLFERIVSAYVFHHFDLAHKIRILLGLTASLKADGLILIGDISFPDRVALEKMKASAGEEWDEEYYWVAEEVLPALASAGFRARYEQVSSCAGVFRLGLPAGNTHE